MHDTKPKGPEYNGPAGLDPKRFSPCTRQVASALLAQPAVGTLSHANHVEWSWRARKRTRFPVDSDRQGGEPMQGWEFWTVAFLVALIVGFSQGGWSAIGNLSVPIMSLVISPLAAVGLLLPVYLVRDTFGLSACRKSFDRRVLSILIPAGLVGVGIGWAVIPFVDTRIPGGETIITGVVGAIGIVFSAYMLFHHDLATPARKARVAPGLFWRTLAGFTSYISHAGAPKYQTDVQPIRLDRVTFAGTTTIFSRS